MTDSGKNWTLKPVEAAKMPGIRMPGGPRNVEGRAGADHTGPSAPGARIAFDQWALRGVCFRSEFLHKRLDMTAFCFAFDILLERNYTLPKFLQWALRRVAMSRTKLFSAPMHLALVGLVCGSGAFAQSERGTIEGTVR